MPIKGLRIVARRTFSPTKQSPRQLLIFVSLCSLLLSTCGTSITTGSLSQKPLLKNSSVQVPTSTSTPQPVFVHDSVNRVYALVAPFPTITDGITFEELKRAWVEGIAPSPFDGHPLLMTEATRTGFRDLWGEPASAAVLTMSAGQLLDTAWSDMPSWAIVPFEELEPKWKVLTIDGQSPIRKNFDLASYPLAVNLILQSQSEAEPSACHRPIMIHPNWPRSS